MKKVRRNGYNITKLRILSAVDWLEESKYPANSRTVSKLAGIGHYATSTRLRELNNLFIVKYDKKTTDRCRLLYKLNETGKRRLNLLLDRMLNGYDLKLQKKPEPYDWTGFVLLPGLEEKKEDM